MQHAGMHKTGHQRLVARDLFGFAPDPRPDRVEACNVSLRPDHDVSSHTAPRPGNLSVGTEKSRRIVPRDQAHLDEAGRGELQEVHGEPYAPGSERPALRRQQ